MGNLPFLDVRNNALPFGQRDTLFAGDQFGGHHLIDRGRIVLEEPHVT